MSDPVLKVGKYTLYQTNGSKNIIRTTWLLNMIPVKICIMYIGMGKRCIGKEGFQLMKSGKMLIGL